VALCFQVFLRRRRAIRIAVTSGQKAWQFKKNGQYQAIYDKWLGVLEPPGSWNKVLQYGAMIMIPLIPF
jgi:hypothetical protein